MSFVRYKFWSGVTAVLCFMWPIGGEPDWLAAPMAWAANTGRFIQKNGEFIFVEDQDPALRLLLERTVKQGTITQEEYDEVRKASQARARATAQDFRIWYDKGLNMSVNDNAFFLKIRAMTQLRYTHWERNSLWRTLGDFKNYPEFLGVFGNLRASRYEGSADTFLLRRARIHNSRVTCSTLISGISFS